MSGGSPRIYRSLPLFNDYLNNFTSYLKEGTPATNANRLGITEEEVVELDGLRDEWNPIWEMYADKKISRTASITARLYGEIDKMVDFDKSHHFLDRIASSVNVTIEDLEVFNIRSGKMQRVASKSPIKSISDTVMPTLVQLGGGMVSMKCYSVESSRPSIHSMANCVQFSFKIGGSPPVSPMDEAMTHDSSTRSSLNYGFGPENSGKQVFIFFRWFNSVHTTLAGPWSSMFTIWLS